MEEDADAAEDDAAGVEHADNALAIAIPATADGEDALGQRDRLVEGFRLAPGAQAVFPFAVPAREQTAYGETITFEDFAGGAGLDGAARAWLLDEPSNAMWNAL